MAVGGEIDELTLPIVAHLTAAEEMAASGRTAGSRPCRD